MLYLGEAFITKSARCKKDSSLQASKQKAEISVQLMKVEALKQSLEELKENNCDLIKLQSALQASHLNLLNVTSQLNVLKSQVTFRVLIKSSHNAL